MIILSIWTKCTRIFCIFFLGEILKKKTMHCKADKQDNNSKIELLNKYKFAIISQNKVNCSLGRQIDLRDTPDLIP